MRQHDQKNISVARGKFHIYPTIIALSIFLCLSAVSYGQSINAQRIVPKTVDLRDGIKLEVVKQERLPEDAVEQITLGKIKKMISQVLVDDPLGCREQRQNCIFRMFIPAAIPAALRTVETGSLFKSGGFFLCFKEEIGDTITEYNRINSRFFISR